MKLNTTIALVIYHAQFVFEFFVNAHQVTQFLNGKEEWEKKSFLSFSGVVWRGNFIFTLISERFSFLFSYYMLQLIM